ncbi:hypothetical protein [Nocardia sp. CA-119907]|uniref:hypothetical protein n=1 Tax=Nocardia sp. CA-119907 TaxID=3239973 RepID=UPI003D996487
MTDVSPAVPESEVHLGVHLGDHVFDYRAAASAARNFIKDWRRMHWEAIDVLCDSIEGLPRLPCERLFVQW